MRDKISAVRQYEGSHLFLVRLQAAEVAAGEVQWYGKVQQVVSGEAYAFEGWRDLIEHLLTMLPDVSSQLSSGQDNLSVFPGKKEQGR